jgi:hypothetical protein
MPKALGDVECFRQDSIRKLSFGFDNKELENGNSRDKGFLRAYKSVLEGSTLYKTAFQSSGNLLMYNIVALLLYS